MSESVTTREKLMKLTVLLLCVLVLGCSSGKSVDDAKAVLKSHEEYVKAGNLEGVISNMTDDIVGVVPGMPLVKGKDAFRIFYANTFKMGKTEGTHDFHGAEAEGDIVILYGFAHGTLTRPDTTMVPLASNFLIVLKAQPDGTMKIWRLAFAPSAQ
jgi:ketosteroid isomerase-like protein